MSLNSPQSNPDKNDGIIITRVLQQHHWTIITCGSTPDEFVAFCKNVTDNHYQSYPDECLQEISFKKLALGYDNWEITPVFKYAKCHSK